MRFLGIAASLALAGTFLSAGAGAVAVAPETRVYRQVGARRLEAYVFRPSVPGASRPAILMFHGGGWKIGEPSWVFDRARELAAGGLVAVAVEYRLSNDGLSPADAVEDACGGLPGRPRVPSTLTPEAVAPRTDRCLARRLTATRSPRSGRGARPFSPPPLPAPVVDV